jgi:hypothetical protein
MSQGLTDKQILRKIRRLENKTGRHYTAIRASNGEVAILPVAELADIPVVPPERIRLEGYAEA